MLCGRSCVWFCQDGLQFLDDLSFLDSCVHGQILCAMPVPFAAKTTYPGMYANDPFTFLAHSINWNCCGVYSGAFTMFASFLSWPVLVIPAGRQVVQCGEKLFRAITRFQLFFHCRACCFQIRDWFWGCVWVVYSHQFAGCFCCGDVQRTFV